MIYFFIFEKNDIFLADYCVLIFIPYEIFQMILVIKVVLKLMEKKFIM